MLKIFGFFCKLTFFSVGVLVLGNWLRWDGKTLSDQIKVRMSHGETIPFFDSFKYWSGRLTQDAKFGLQKKFDHFSLDEEIPSSEKQKLKALIRDLNSTHKKD